MITPHPPADAPLDVLMCEAWKSLDWLAHGFSQRTGGSSTVYGDNELNLGFTAEDAPETVLANRERLVKRLLNGYSSTSHNESTAARLVTLQQVHSATVHCVQNDQPIEPGDGLMTDQPGKLLAILTADCVPVLVLDQRLRAVAGFHAGWRGTVQGIVRAGVARMQAHFGCRPEDLSAAIGPCIGACCYTVGEEVRREFGAQFSHADELFTQKNGGPLYLDLIEANRRQLLDAGLSVESIHAPGLCTGCHPERFFSYRKSGGRTGRMMSVIGILPADSDLRG